MTVAWWWLIVAFIAGVFAAPTYNVIEDWRYRRWLRKEGMRL